ncbi:MAG: LolA family protein [Candidatus Brocadiia bacterium]
MKRLVALCAGFALAATASAGAETLDEAVERLAKAEQGVDDLAAKAKLDMTTGTAQVTMTISGTTDTKMRRSEDHRLVRAATEMTAKMDNPPQGMPGGGEMKMTQLMVVDGDFMWMEMKNPGLPQPMVMKMNIPDPSAAGSSLQGGAMGMGMGAASLVADLKGQFERMKTMSDLKLVGPGKVLDRPTTVVEATYKPEVLEKLPKQALAKMPTRMVIDFDDATGQVLALQGFSSDGTQRIAMETTQIEVNQGIEKTLFQYSPPAGAKIRDLTQQGETPPKAPQ